ncbi:polyketide cyclase/dehydrase/lipid transport protein [Micromonospora pisi]|uniref:Polyketide cyclase/dehydrase/lipid transport protein n=1 Tax=Micromonospora pisi TaxID=589240 RepID=A0A495JJE6_9ACTN|nr:SRPBCC family protein [Micromonospora pisi]RKR88941.1 polyketide cyclase/dehydrase/lipid transport protein [Micromonospora pisi]
MATVAVTRVVDAPADELWRVFTDLPGRAGWLSTVTGIEVLTPGPLRVGSTWREGHRLPDGTELAEEFRVEEAVPPHRLTVTSAGIGVEYRTAYTFTPIEGRRRRRAGRTAVSVVQEGSVTAPYGRLLALVFGGLAARTVEGVLRRDLADLAAAVAADAPEHRGGPAAAA